MKYIINCFLLVSSLLGITNVFAQTAINFSYVGFHASESSIPQLSEQSSVTLTPSGGDDTQLIQAAVDALGELPLNQEGFRGIIQLSTGVFRTSQPIRINHSGIILRGEGKQTEIRINTLSRAPLFILRGNENRFRTMGKLIDNAPVGTMKIKIDNASSFTAGQRVTIRRPATAEWISFMQADTAQGNFVNDRIHWRVGQRDIYWDRQIKAISKGELTLDAPLTLPLDLRFGGVEVGNGVISPICNIGLQDMTLVGGEAFAHIADEEHSWIGVLMDAVEDVWIRNIGFKHFCASAVRVGRHARRVTIEECRSSEPICENIGYRNQAFYVEGQQVLVRECRVEAGRNDFVVGLCAAGPNVFLDCVSIKPVDDSGAWESFATGTLFEGMDLGGGGLYLTYDNKRTQGACWTAANSVVWNCKHGHIRSEGHSWAPNVVCTNKSESLFASMLKNRIGVQKEITVGQIPTIGIRSEQDPAPLTSLPSVIPISLVNGRFVSKGHSLLGGSVNDAWWLGRIDTDSACTAGVSVTRFIPGRYGHGLTEDIPQLVDSMIKVGNYFYENGPGLWYDRRRDDHLYLERTNSYVWAPFYELPWARTGEGKAWDGTSLYNLTQFNPWYFHRIKELAQQCDKQGVVLLHSLFNTHNLLEIAPHWCDYPARPTNCINTTQLPEPMPLEPRGRIHLANEYYSVTDTALCNFHRLYIEKVLDELSDYSNTFFCVGFQYSGPLSFLKFFHRTVATWEKKSGKNVKLLLRTSKAFTDSILSVPEFARQVAAIDMRYWQYRPDGSLFAPQAGQNMAYREMIGETFKGYGGPMPATTSYQIYRQVREYTDKYPSKAIMAWKNEENIVPVIMAGAAQVIYRNPTAGHGQRLRRGNTFELFFERYLANCYHRMKPVDNCLEQSDSNWAMRSAEGDIWLLYSLQGTCLRPLFNGKNNYQGIWYQPEDGKVLNIEKMSIKPGQIISKPDERNWLLLIKAL